MGVAPYMRLRHVHCRPRRGDGAAVQGATDELAVHTISTYDGGVTGSFRTDWVLLAATHPGGGGEGAVAAPLSRAGPGGTPLPSPPTLPSPPPAVGGGDGRTLPPPRVADTSSLLSSTPGPELTAARDVYVAGDALPPPGWGVRAAAATGAAAAANMAGGRVATRLPPPAAAVGVAGLSLGVVGDPDGRAETVGVWAPGGGRGVVFYLNGGRGGGGGGADRSIVAVVVWAEEEEEEEGEGQAGTAADAPGAVDVAATAEAVWAAVGGGGRLGGLPPGAGALKAALAAAAAGAGRVPPGGGLRHTLPRRRTGADAAAADAATAAGGGGEVLWAAGPVVGVGGVDPKADAYTWVLSGGRQGSPGRVE